MVNELVGYRHFVYLIKNKINEKIYVGVHSCPCDFLDTKYYGSGDQIKAAIKKYGKENFDRYVIDECVSRDEAHSLEALIVDDHFRKNPDTYNIIKGGDGGVGGMLAVPVKSLDKDGNIEHFASIEEARIRTGSAIVGTWHGKRSNGRMWFREDSEIPEKYLVEGIYPPQIKSKDIHGNINYYYNSVSAGKQIGIPGGAIRHSLYGNGRLSGGMIWAKVDEEFRKWPNSDGRKAVEATFPDGSTKRYISTCEAARELGVDNSAISKVCLGKQEHCRKIIFKYWSDDGE